MSARKGEQLCDVPPRDGGGACYRSLGHVGSHESLVFHRNAVARHRAQRRAITGYTGNSRPPAHSFYICVDAEQAIVKFGITNNTQRRLATHARGTSDRPFHLDIVIAVREYLDEGEPKAWEDAVKAVLKEEGATPIAGTEYFDAQWIEAIIQVARDHGMWVPGFELAA